MLIPLTRGATSGGNVDLEYSINIYMIVFFYDIDIDIENIDIDIAEHT